MKPSLKAALAAAVLIAESAIALAASFFLAPLQPAPALSGPPAEALSATLKAKPKSPAGLAPGAFSVTRIAHALVLLDFGIATVLTDPWFSEKTHFHHGEPLGIAPTAPRLTSAATRG